MKAIRMTVALLVFPLIIAACAGKSEKQQEQQPSESNVEKVGLLDTTATVDNEEQDSQGVQPLTDGGIDEIREVWCDREFNVKPGDKTPGIHEFASSFCKQYPGFLANKKMMQYLMDMKGYNEENTGFHITDRPRNGYLRCSSMSQYDNSTTCCYWKRKNGHRLVAFCMQEDHEADDSGKDLVVFYDYDVENDLMTPEPSLTDMVEKLVKKHDAYDTLLPDEGKDIEIDAFDFSEDSAQEYQYLLIWDGQTFKIQK